MPLKEKLKNLKMLKSNTITQHLTKVIVGSLVVVIGTVSVIVFSSGRVQLLKGINEEIVTVGGAVQNSLSSFFSNATKNIMTLANDDIIINGVTTDFENMKDVLKKINVFKGINGEIIDIHVASKNNKYVGTSKVKNPTSQEWFKQAIANKVFWSDPTWDAKTSRYVTSVAVSINEGAGVICFDLDFTQAVAGNENLKVGQEGFFSLVIPDANGQYRVAYVSNDEYNKALAGKVLTDAAPGTEEANVNGLLEAIGKKVDNIENGFETTEITLNDERFDVVVEDKGIGVYKIVASNYEEGYEKREALFTSSVFAGAAVAVLAIFVLRRFIAKIGKDLSSINDAVSKLKEGDLTVELDGEILNVEHEVGELANNLNTTVSSLNKLVHSIELVATDLGAISKNVSISTDETNSRIEEISLTMNDIVEGISDQASSAEQSNCTVTQLATKLNELETTTKSITKLTEEVRKENELGSKSIGDLQYYTEQSNKSNNEVSVNVKELSKKTKDVETIVSTISSIAEQTNLLALNAAIEAARAGEHGAGFSVVAGEVKKLAEQSARYAEDIKSIVNGIQSDVTKTVSVMDESTKIIDAQNAAVNTVVESFKVISDSTTNMDTAINSVYEFVEVLNEDKNSIVSGIENISIVSQKSAASSEEISASIQEQTALTQNLSSTVVTLNELTENLSGEVKNFKTEK